MNLLIPIVATFPMPFVLWSLACLSNYTIIWDQYVQEPIGFQLAQSGLLYRVCAPLWTFKFHDVTKIKLRNSMTFLYPTLGMHRGVAYASEFYWKYDILCWARKWCVIMFCFVLFFSLSMTFDNFKYSKILEIWHSNTMTSSAFSCLHKTWL